MLRRIFLVSFLSGVLISCNSKAKIAKDYYERMIILENSLFSVLSSSDSMARGYIIKKQHDSLVLVAGKAEELLQEKIDSLNQVRLSGVVGGEEFITAYVRTFKYIKNVQIIYKNLGLAGSIEERKAVIKDLKKIVVEVEMVVNDMQSEKKKFADANGFIPDRIE